MSKSSQTLSKPGIVATICLEKANKTKAIIAEFNLNAKDDKHFRELVLAYFKPEIRF